MLGYDPARSALLWRRTTADHYISVDAAALDSTRTVLARKLVFEFSDGFSAIRELCLREGDIQYVSFPLAELSDRGEAHQRNCEPELAGENVSCRVQSRCIHDMMYDPQ